MTGNGPVAAGLVKCPKDSAPGQRSVKRLLFVSLLSF